MVVVVVVVVGVVVVVSAAGAGVDDTIKTGLIVDVDATGLAVAGLLAGALVASVVLVVFEIMTELLIWLFVLLGARVANVKVELETELVSSGSGSRI